MAIQIVQIKGRSCPVVFCDYCYKQITEARDGNYEWLAGNDGRPLDGNIYFTHRRCRHAFEETFGGKAAWYASDLRVFPVYMFHNLQIDQRKAKELSDLLGAM
jgi:hypothetical protein